MRSDLALAALASAAVPGMKPVAVAAIHPADDDSSEEHQQAMVEDATGRRWLVRAPLTPVAGARLQQHDELVRQLSRHVPFKVPAPVGYADVGRDGRAAVYPFVEGSPVDLRRLPAGPGLASALARAVAAVHNIPRGAFEEQDVPVLDAAGCRQRLIADVDRAAETGRVPTGLLARWEEAFDAAPLWQFATTPVHGRFRGSTVLVTFTDDDAGSGRVVAVTGWEEAAVSDPALDLAELCSQASPQAWASVLESYTLARAQRPDPYLHVRARLHAEVRALRGLASAVAEDREDVVRRTEEALRRMDRLTEDDDALVPVTARGAATAVDASGGGGTAVAPATEPSGPTEDEWQESTGRDVEHQDAPVTDDVDHQADAVEDEVDVRDGELDDRADDVTMEVPVPGHLRAAPPAGTPSVEHEREDDRSSEDGDRATQEPRPEPVGDTSAAAGGAVDTVAQAEVEAPHGEEVREPAGAGQETGTQDGADVPQQDVGAEETAPPGGTAPDDADELDDEHRLTELYGMPAGTEDGTGDTDAPTTPPSGTG